MTFTNKDLMTKKLTKGINFDEIVSFNYSHRQPAITQPHPLGVNQQIDVLSLQLAFLP